MKEALFYNKLKDKKTRCFLCPHNCLIAPGKTGFCGVRKNIDGKLFSLNYGKAVALQIDPIEKKPFYHFHPGTNALSFGTAGCNFRCLYCCNWQMSHSTPDQPPHLDLLPEKIVKEAKNRHVQGIAYTYNEPTIFFEYAYDTAKLSKKQGFYNVFVTNGYTSPKPIKKAARYINAAVINFKGFNEKVYAKLCRGGLLDIKLAVEEYKKTRMWIEISNLLIPGYTDKEKEIQKFCKWILETCGENTPLHFIGFFPSYKMMDVPAASQDLLKKAHTIAKNTGLKYVYARIPEGFDTKCASCNKTLIKRSLFDFTVIENNLKKGKCSCGEKLPGVF